MNPGIVWRPIQPLDSDPLSHPSFGILDLYHLLIFSGEGRNVLEARITALVAELRNIRRDYKLTFLNLTSVQNRCNALLFENRTLKMEVKELRKVINSLCPTTTE